MSGTMRGRAKNGRITSTLHLTPQNLKRLEETQLTLAYNLTETLSRSEIEDAPDDLMGQKTLATIRLKMTPVTE